MISNKINCRPIVCDTLTRSLEQCQASEAGTTPQRDGSCINHLLKALSTNDHKHRTKKGTTVCRGRERACAAAAAGVVETPSDTMVDDHAALPHSSRAAWRRVRELGFLSADSQWVIV